MVRLGYLVRRDADVRAGHAGQLFLQAGTETEASKRTAIKSSFLGAVKMQTSKIFSCFDAFTENGKMPQLFSALKSYFP